MNGGWLAGCILVLSGGSFSFGDDRPPEINTKLPGVTMHLVAEHPDLATPTGVDVDSEGSVWVVACHTHMPPEDYAGPEFDQVLVFNGVRHDDTAIRQRTIFYQKTHHTMDLELGPDGWVYLAERDRILRIRDSDGDGTADLEEDLAVLATEADYPHNGLSGLAWHPDGDLCFSLGENFAKRWTLTATDGSSSTGSGEGAVFRMSADGKNLHRIARGMWNPFGLVVRSDGEMFAVENDPGERPPCRLLHIVEGGDYGYQREYGPGSHHPFVGWNGELRGTLPMIHPVGEGPCGVAAFRNGLIVPSWSDHRIDFHLLSPNGASFSAERIMLVKGGRYFRPVCLAEDKRFPRLAMRSWYVSDWVDGRYPVHGYGRLWRLEIDLARSSSWMGEPMLAPASELAKLATTLRSDSRATISDQQLIEYAKHEDPFVAQAAVRALASRTSGWEAGALSRDEPLVALLALKLRGTHNREVAPRWVPEFLESKDDEVIFETLRWIADARLIDFTDEVDAILNSGDIPFEIFEAAMATKNTLAGKPELGLLDMEAITERLLDPETPPRLQAYVLRLAVSKPRSNSKQGEPLALRYPRGLTVELLGEMLDAGDELLELEAIRTLAGNPIPARGMLARVAADEKRSDAVRVEAVIGLAAQPKENAEALQALAKDPSELIREEAERALRTAPKVEGERPALTDTEAWLARLDAVKEPVDIERGRRLFHHPRLAICSNCHRHEGRGSVVGPDLTRIDRIGNRAALLESILHPNAEIAPEYLPRTVTFHDGEQFTGIRLRSSTREAMRDAAGRTVTFNRDDIAEMQELQVSFMPTGLPLMMTDRELRDLIAFLEKR
jgi:putative membrane-bound dehydrogenase-like protein